MFQIPPDSPALCIVTFDGGSDQLRPGRWIAELRGKPETGCYGQTEEEAVASMRKKLEEVNTDIKSLPVVRAVAVPYRESDL